MVVDPVERGVREDQIETAIRLPCLDAVDRPCDRRVIVASAVDHLLRGVDPRDVGLGPPSCEQRSEVPGSASEVDDPACVDVGDAGDEFDPRTGAMVGEAKVPVWIPRHRASVSGFALRLRNRLDHGPRLGRVA